MLLENPIPEISYFFLWYKIPSLNLVIFFCSKKVQLLYSRIFFVCEKIPSLGSVHFLLSEKSIFEFYIFSMKTSNLWILEVKCLRFFFYRKNLTYRVSLIFSYGTKFHPWGLTIFSLGKIASLGSVIFFLSEKNTSLDFVGFHSFEKNIICRF